MLVEGLDSQLLIITTNIWADFLDTQMQKIEDFSNKKSLTEKYEKLFKIENLKNETRKKHLKALRIFSDFLEENEIISENFARKIKPPRVQQQLAKPLEDYEINQIFQAINHHYTWFLKERNTIIIKTFLNTGLRLMELLSLEKTDFSKNRIFVKNGKWWKDRIIYLEESFSKELKNFLQKYPSIYIFTNIRKQKLSESGLKRLFEKIKKYTKNPNIHPHRLRHTYATKLIENWVNIGIVKEQMGHTNISTTNRYIGVRDKHREEIMKIMKIEF